MLIVRPVRDKNFQKQLCSLAEIEYNAEAFAFFAANSDDLGETFTSYIGIALFDIDKFGVKLLSVSMMPQVDDMEAMTILARSLMCYLYRNMSVKLLYASDDIDQKYFKAFCLARDNDNRLVVDLEDFYNAPCKYNS